MTKETLKQSILTELDTGTIKQTPPIVFMLKEYSMLFAALVTIVIGSFSLAIIFAAVDDLPSTMYAVHKSGIGGAVLLLPYVWFIFMGLFLYLGYDRIRSSEHGYKYPMAMLGFTVVAISVVGGALIYTSGIAHSTDQFVADHVPVYRKYVNPQHEIWRNSNSGVIAGRVFTIGTSTLEVRDVNGKLWNVSMNLEELPLFDRLQEHMHIKILGEKTATGTFFAKEVFISKSFGRPFSNRDISEPSERKLKPVRNTR